VKLFLREAVPQRNRIPGAVIAIQTFGDFLGFNPHWHVLVTDGCFYGRGMFRVAPPLDLLFPIQCQSLFPPSILTFSLTN
jgi:hypothetical protein